MTMKKRITCLWMVGLLPLTLWAQDDDMYFVPSKENVAKEARSYGLPQNTYYSGSERSVDDYNRKAWTTVSPVDSAGNDIIDFSAVRGVYPDSSYTVVEDNDYQLTRRMSRFDDYAVREAYWNGYRDATWTSPWYYPGRYSWYDPWYWDGWYGGYYHPWYGGWYGGYYGYYRPWYGGYYSYYSPRYYGRVHHTTTPRMHVSRHTAAGSRSYSNGNSVRYNGGTFGGNGVQRSTSVTRSTSSGSTSSGSHSLGNFGGSRSSGGSFGGGSRSGGSSGGGGRFGGRR